MAFRVHSLGGGVDSGAERDDVGSYLWTLHRRLHNAEDAQTRVYTCRSWRAPEGVTCPHELHWNDSEVPGETFLGSFGWAVSGELVERIEAEFARGEAVRLFIFNSDADLCYEEVLAPVARS